MTAKYRIEIELLLDERAATKAIELARDVYRNVVAQERWKMASNEK
jgi:hypothetical protein